ncbi:hypothetical protein [Nocardia sp. R6R-6]|uniref:hypothetical protein n=1 Tax=Nocardia sp. R6R-6 TaxID=3459303 RepID=UPI00403D6B1D
MIVQATREQIGRWELRSRDCKQAVCVEGQEHARYLLSAHAGHGGECQPYQDALSAVSAALG